MVMTTESVPKGSTVAEAKSTEKNEPKEAPKAKLARAGESSDAGVQQLLARREIHATNGDQARVADVDRELEALGYTAQ